MTDMDLKKASSAIRHYLSEDVTKKLLCPFVLSRLDYCNSFLSGCPKYLYSELQKVQTNAARLIFRTTRSAHVTPMPHFLHWLPIEQRIEYKLSLLCFKIISHQAPVYLSELLHLYTPSRQLRSSTDTRVFSLITLIAPICDWCVCVCIRACACVRVWFCVCVRVCEHSCCMH